MKSSWLALLAALIIGGFLTNTPVVCAADAILVVQNASQPITSQNATPSEAEQTEEDDLDEYEDEDDDEAALVRDPIEPWNRTMFIINDTFYFWLLKPVARGYRFVVPTPLRTMVKNFFYNVKAPVRIVNCLLQGKGQAALGETGRFVLNSTGGILGLGDPAKDFPALNPHPEDLGQTLGFHGIGNGFYIVWPVLGPSTMRDTVGFAGDSFLQPLSYIDPPESYYALVAWDKVNATSFRIGDYEALIDAAFDPYIAIRNAYIQNRNAEIEK